MGPPTDQIKSCCTFVFGRREEVNIGAGGQGRTHNSWGPWAIGDHGAPVSLPKLKNAYEKGTRGISWGPLLTPGPRAVPEFPNGQSAPAGGILWHLFLQIK
ncbi:unnamed protein product, partial [Staurois parvus]